MLQIKIDTTADALYIKLKKGRISKTQNRGDYLVDYNKNGDLLGFEIINFSKKVPKSERGLVSMIDDRKIPIAR